MRLTLALIFALLLSASSALCDTRVQQFYDQGLTQYKHSNFTAAAELFEQGLALARLQNDTQAVFVFTGNLGVTYANLGQFKKVVGMNEQALALARKLKDAKSEAMILSNIGGAWDSMGDLEKAAENYRAALEIFRRLQDQKGILSNVGNLGILYDRYGDSATAITYYNESIKTAGEIKDIAGLANMLTNLGIANSHSGDHHAALVHYGQALEQYNALQDKKGISDVYLNLGIAYSNLGDHGAAIEYLNQAYEIKTVIGDKKGLADTIGSLGSVYERQGSNDKAIIQYRSALAMQSEMGVSTQMIQAKLGDAFIAAKEFGEAKEILEKLGDPVRLGRLELAQGRLENAAAYFETALKTNPDSRDPMFLFAANCGLGQALLGKNVVEAEGSLEKAVLYNEEQRETLNEQERSRFFAEKVYGFSRIVPYESMVELHCRNRESREAFTTSESLKARILSESLAGRYAAFRNLLPEAARADEDAANIGVRAIRKVLQYAHAANESSMYASLESQLKDVLDKRNCAISSLRKKYPDYAALAYPQPVKPSEVRLNNNEALIEFEVCQDKTCVFLLRKNDVTVTEVPLSREALKELVMQYHRSFEDINDYAALSRFDPALSEKLYKLLLAGAVKGLPEKTNLIIVPDEFLGLISFESLVCDVKGSRRMGEGKFGAFPLNVIYLADRFGVRYAQSATTFTMSRARPVETAKDDSVLVFCDPVFSSSDKRAGAVKSVPPEGAGNTAVYLKKMGSLKEWGNMGITGIKDKGAATAKYTGLFPRLEKTRQIMNVANTFFGLEHTTAYSGLQASEDQVHKCGIEKYKYLIFATHGILDSTIPWIKEPALVLSQVGNRFPDDGFLTMSEIMGMKIPAELAFLAACRSGVGEEVSGEGVMGLGRAFQYAGCQNTVISLWSVNEDATVQLISALLENIKDGQSPHEALISAKQKIRAQGYEHPFYWSAFVEY